MKELSWLNSYARLNKIACEESIRRMAKNYLEISDNIIDKMLYKRAGLIGARFFDASNEINKF